MSLYQGLFIASDDCNPFLSIHLHKNKTAGKVKITLIAMLKHLGI